MDVLLGWLLATLELHDWLLTLIVFAPALGAVLLWIPPRSDEVGARRAALFVSAVTLALTAYALVRFYAVAPEIGAASTSRIIPVAASNTASNRATGNPQPTFCPPG